MVGQVFQRSEKLQDEVFSLKLRIPEWKVLFTLDGNMDVAQVSEFLGFSESEVQQILGRLQNMGLVEEVSPRPEPVSGTEAPGVQQEEAVQREEQIPEERPSQQEKEEAVSTEDEFNLLGTGELSEPASLEKEQQQAPTQEAPAESAPAMEAESSETESLEFPGEEDDFLESLPLDEEEPDSAEDIFADLTREEAPAASEKEDEFDQLIGDLVDSTPGEEAPAPEAEKPGEAQQAQTESVESKTEEEFDIGSIFEDELAATEQSLKEMLVSLEEEQTQVEKPPAEGEKEKARRTILVVDDSVVIRKMVEIALENENYEIVSVATGKEALQYLDEHTPDLIILDIMLTDVNGLDILKAVKASKNIPVVMLSAKDTPRETTKAKELGADDFIPKPFKDEELVSKVRELIEA